VRRCDDGKARGTGRKPRLALRRLAGRCIYETRIQRGAPSASVRGAIKALGQCALRTGALLAQRRIHQPAEHVGWRFRFADGTTTECYRETVVDRPPPAALAILVVSFRLRRVRGYWGHAIFRWESVLNTVLSVGFPGLITKLWLRHDEHGVYRGLYEWDDPLLAVAYVRALW